jgi:hypothetical protein
MQMKDASDLRRRWASRPCKHPHLEKEYDLGMSTGDYVCTTCGHADAGSDWNQKEQHDADPSNGE